MKQPEAKVPIEIARAKQSDLPGIAVIYDDAVINSVASFDVRPRTEKEAAEWFKSHGQTHPILVARRNGAVVGWGSINVFHGRVAYEKTVEDSVYVARDCRGMGIGGQILARLIGEAREAGHHTIVARIADHNPASIALHRSFGFKEAGVLLEVGRKFDRWIDVTHMQLLLE